MKLYVLIRSNLSKSQQAVQGGHAVAEWVKTHWIADNEWDNTLVYLRADEYDIEDFIEIGEEYSSPSAIFKEPDLDNQITAISILGKNGIPELLNNFRLV